MSHFSTTSRASSSFTHPPQNYEVFLSFRGEDTRHSFTDHLYHRLVDRGIMVFRDNEELHVGEKIDQLFEAIQTSKISILIISPDYASSLWCLKELLRILECKKTWGQLVLPIFYHVKPSDIREQKGNFGKKFRLCKRKHELDGKLVQKLENAFTEIATMKGWESNKIAERHEGELVKIIVTKIFNVLRKAVLVVPDFLVGVEDHVKKIKKMIDARPSNGAKIIGIHGMGGMGKTTLAKVLYNTLSSDYECHSFVPGIREESKNKGMEALQKHIISDILADRSFREISHVDEGLTIIEKSFKGKRLLLLLDDIENKDQLNELAPKNSWFGSESMIIITTRNKDVTVASSVNLSYELNELNNDQSYELFCRHAFGWDASCPKNLETIARDIITTTGGLPLAIEIIGSLLYQKDEDIWKEKVEKLRRIPNEKVRNKLKISYDSLEYEQQQIYLDIACLPIEYELEFAYYMWKSCCFYPKEGIERLISLSLIKVEVGSNRIIMHDQLRDLGRDIVRQEGRDNFGLCSRLWLEEEAIEVIERKQGTSNVQALILQHPLDDYEAIHCTSQQFEGMTNLRFLTMHGVHLSGDFKNIFLNLRWLRWRPDSYCQNDIDVMQINFNSKKLVVLDLYKSNITEHWRYWSQIKYLKVLKLHRCLHLNVTPDFSTLKELEVLILRWCSHLRKIHSSIGKFSKKLKVLDVSLCKELGELPIEVGKMEELRELLICRTGIKQIPLSEGYMTKLELLSVQDCKELEELPIEVGKMEELRYLNIAGSSIRQIPIFEGYLTKLEILLANNCQQLAHIPDSLGSLVKLRSLELYDCQLLTKIPESIGKLRFLIKLDLRKTSVKELPDSITELCNLEELCMCGNPIKCLPSSIGLLSKLQDLDLMGCGELKSLPNLPLSLTSLAFSGDSMEMLPDFSNLPNLNKLIYKDLFERRNRAISFGNLNQVQSLRIYNTNIHDTWKRLDLEEEIQILYPTKENFSLQLELPKSLVELHINGCQTLHSLPNLSNLKNLSNLCLKDCIVLKELNGLKGAESLTNLEIGRCKMLSRLGGLSHLKVLTTLSLHACEKLSDVQGIEKLTSLTHLSISSCHPEIKFPNLSTLRDLEYLRINCQGLTEIPGLQELKSLKDLDISGCKLLRYLPDLSRFTNLWNLSVMHCENLIEIRGLQVLKSLKALDIAGCKSLQYLPDLLRFTNLESLNIRKLHKKIEGLKT